MSQHNNPVRYRRTGTGTKPAGSRYVLAGQKDHYDWNSAADLAEYYTVVNYSRR
ncbi:hypothetical protein AB0M43_34895 [Longispora sp. NPDC051575]|uniref:hypothetical protein n=1 Tax=Longispora sp. NPDC051575 TaxID=3154943 RepID=UPI003432BA09